MSPPCAIAGWDKAPWSRGGGVPVLPRAGRFQPRRVLIKSRQPSRAHLLAKLSGTEVSEDLGRGSAALRHRDLSVGSGTSGLCGTGP